jgi:hypothetical protein
MMQKLFFFRISDDVGRVAVTASNLVEAEEKLWRYLRRVYGENGTRELRIERWSEWGDVLVD